MKKLWLIIWGFVSFVGECLLWYLKNSDYIKFSDMGFIIGFVMVPVLAGLLIIGVPYLFKKIE